MQDISDRLFIFLVLLFPLPRQHERSFEIGSILPFSVFAWAYSVIFAKYLIEIELIVESQLRRDLLYLKLAFPKMICRTLDFTLIDIIDDAGSSMTAKNGT